MRQFLWGISSLGLAWALAAASSIVILYFHISRREAYAFNLPRSFWIVVVIPLLFVYIIRLPFPDYTFDVLNYHIVNFERSLRGYPHISGDFFPTMVQVNPTPDMVAGIFFHALGYRLGTLVNLFALLWLAATANKFLNRYIESNLLRSVSVLLVISTEMLLYQLNTYLVDLLALPLLLEATYLAWRLHDLRNRSYTLLHIASFLGLSIAFKLTHAAFAIPVVALCLYNVARYRLQLDLRYIVVSALCLIVPVLPFSIFMYWQTGNPVFPFYNGIFASPYLVPANYADPLHGPKNFIETVFWSFWVMIEPARLSEMSGDNAAYTGRITISFVFSVICVGSRSINTEVRALSYVSLLGCMLWSISTGNGRYGLFLEVFGMIALLCFTSSLFTKMREDKQITYAKTNTCIMLVTSLMVVQCVTSYRHALQQSQYLFGKIIQPTLFNDSTGFTVEAKQLFNDHSFMRYLSSVERERFSQVDVWINSYYATSGIEELINPHAPMLAVCDHFTVFDYFTTAASQKRFAEELSQLRGKRMFSLTHTSHLRETLQFITRRGLRIGSITRTEIPYFSDSTRLDMTLIEVLPPAELVAGHTPPEMW